MEPGRYGILDCPDCGSQVPKTSPNLKRCKPCALAAHGQTGHGFKERQCLVCEVLYKPTGSSQKCCDSCRPAYRQEQNVLHLRELRKQEGAVAIGATLQCLECNADFIYSSGPQKHCLVCLKKRRAEQARKSLAKNPKRDEYIRKAKDNYSFGGNRQNALERDNFTCQHCGATEYLHVHHIDGAGVTTPKELRNNALDNLLTLCRSCHTRVHHSNCAPQR